MKKSIPVKWVLLLFCISMTLSAFSQSPDTIFYNSYWQITEKPFATYYRVASFAYGNPSLIFTGKVTDYYMNGAIEMEGEYDTKGRKTGPFRFYYNDGKLSATGNYKDDALDGEWQYFYKNGMPVSVLLHNREESTFSVINYRDSSGQELTKNGNGYFKLSVLDDLTRLPFNVEGEMLGGEKNGVWKYFTKITPGSDRNIMLFRENYKKGKQTKTTLFYPNGELNTTYLEAATTIKVRDLEKFYRTDIFSVDLLIFPFIDVKYSDSALVSFLVDKNPVFIDVRGKSFDESFNAILSKLNSRDFIRLFRQDEKNYNGKVYFSISDSGELGNFDVTGNFDEAEKELITSLLKKFRNVPPLQIENVQVDANHMVYYYTINSNDILPRAYQKKVNEKTMLFTFIPYEKLIEKLKKEMKLRIETMEAFQNFMNSNIRWQLRN